jgi:hypothetical protein
MFTTAVGLDTTELNPDTVPVVTAKEEALPPLTGITQVPSPRRKCVLSRFDAAPTAPAVMSVRSEVVDTDKTPVDTAILVT